MITICSNIVVPFDNSDLSKKALQTAMTLAKQDERIELKLITVMDMMKFPPSRADIDPVREGFLTATKDFLSEVEDTLKTIPNKTETFILEGSAGSTIVDFIQQKKADLVVMGCRGLSGLTEMFLGSVSHYVAQKAPCPVFIIK